MGWSCSPSGAFVEGVKMGSGSLDDSFNPRGKMDSRNGFSFRVVFPGRAADVAADDTLHGQGLGLLHKHAPASQDIAVGFAFGRELLHVRRDEVVADDVGHLPEPELGEFRQDLTLSRDGVRHDDVEGRDPVRRHDEEVLPQVVDVADFAAVDKLQAFQVGLVQGRLGHGVLLAQRT